MNTSSITFVPYEKSHKFTFSPYKKIKFKRFVLSLKIEVIVHIISVI